MQRVSLNWLTVCSVIACAACAVEPGESSTGAASTIPIPYKIAANKIAANKIAANKIAANRIALGRLALNVGAAGDLVATADGREVLTFLVSCALPIEERLVTTFDGVDYEFFGELGLAPGWIHRPLNQVDRGWVSACMFSRVNAHDVAVPISLRGPTPALAVTREERATFSVEEGAFYGQLFTPEPQPIQWIACRGRGLAGGAFGGLSERDCAKPDPDHPGRTLCGFVFAGDCGDYARDRACESYSVRGQFYRRCHAAPLGRGHHGDDDRHDDDDRDDDDDGRDGAFHQVITTFVTP